MWRILSADRMQAPPDTDRSDGAIQAARRHRDTKCDPDHLTFGDAHHILVWSVFIQQ